MRSGLTLEDLATVSGVSRAMLSKIERGEKNPTLVVAAKMASALGVTLTDLTGAGEERSAVVVIPKSSRLVFRDPDTGFERQLLSPAFEGRNLEFVRHVLPQGAGTGDLPPYKRGVEKYLVVERGRLGVEVGGASYNLREGDALYFEAHVRHRFDNPGGSECSYYLVISLRT